VGVGEAVVNDKKKTQKRNMLWFPLRKYIFLDIVVVLLLLLTLCKVSKASKDLRSINPVH